MIVLAFDRDWTVDVNPHPSHEAVPLEWVRYWAHETDHEVWAIGNQALTREADVSGIVDLVEAVNDRPAERVLGEPTDGRYPDWPLRRERLRMLDEQFPDADEYVVVDDLDLSDVEGWTHYHAWEFVPAVERGAVAVDSPRDRDAVTDGGRPSSVGVAPADADVLQRWLDEHADSPGFEIDYESDGQTHRTAVDGLEVVQRTLDRPAAAPAIRCYPAGPGADPFTVRFDDVQLVTRIKRVTDLVPETGTPAERAAGLRKQAEVAPERVDPSAVLALLDADEPGPRTDALHALRALAEDRPSDCRPALTGLRSLLRDDGLAEPELVLGTLAELAAAAPADVAPLADEIVPYVSADDALARRRALRCLSELMANDTREAVDAVPAVATAVEDDVDGRAYAVHVLCRVADDYPEVVRPVVPTLQDVLVDEAAPDGERLNAAAALGRVTSEYPDAALPVIEELVALTGADHFKLRNNALGVVADVATLHQEWVVPYAADVARFLDADDDYTRINASGALSRLARTHPAEIELYVEEFVDRLADDHRFVRENACWALGHLGAAEAAEALRSVAREDEEPAVRKRAQWALAEL